jgi:2-dehydro-3-deoxyphosphogluconate aldolase/(4S)-4-hydroxy-2-oxoglutarate aldolase
MRPRTTPTSDLRPSAVLDHLATHRLLPVVVLDDPGSAADLAAALVAGGLPLAEVTFRTPRAVESLRLMAANTDLCVGAGTVLTVDQVDAAVEAGARFVVSPGLNEGVVRRCAELDVLAIPGVATATEITDALAAGVRVAKLFPAAQLGGPPAVRALAGPFPQMRFVPTGGISAEIAPEYLSHPAVLAVGGSWMVPAEAMTRRDFARIAELTGQAVAAVQGEGGTHG